MAGTMNGFFQFFGQRCDLVLTPDSAGQAEIHAVNLGITAPDDGTYAFQVDGEISSSIDYDATVTEMKTALENMKCVKNRGYTATFSANAQNGSFNITFNANRDGRVSDEIGIVRVVGNNLNDGGEECKPITTVSQYGRKGFLSGSNYAVEIYIWKFVEMCVDKQGKIRSRDL
jgi:hypothetical protein